MFRRNYKELSKKLLSPLSYGVKAVIFAIFLLLAANHWWWAILFVLSAFYFYLKPRLNAGQFFSSFLVLLIASLFFINLPLITHYSLLISLFFGFLFFILLGIKNLIFLNRQNFYQFLNGLLFLSIFILFFDANKSEIFIVKYLMVGLAVFLLSKEILKFGPREFIGLEKSLNLIPAVFTFLTLQVLWAIALLPIGFLNSASLALLVILVLQDFSLHHFSGTISRQITLRNITLFLVFSLFIFAASKWTP